MKPAQKSLPFTAPPPTLNPETALPRRAMLLAGRSVQIISMLQRGAPAEDLTREIDDVAGGLDASIDNLRESGMGEANEGRIAQYEAAIDALDVARAAVVAGDYTAALPAIEAEAFQRRPEHVAEIYGAAMEKRADV